MRGARGAPDEGNEGPHQLPLGGAGAQAAGAGRQGTGNCGVGAHGVGPVAFQGPVSQGGRSAPHLLGQQGLPGSWRVRYKAQMS